MRAAHASVGNRLGGRLAWSWAISALALQLFSVAGCTTPGAGTVANPDAAAYLDLILPARVEIQRYLTRPVSFAGDGEADGLEVVLAAYDGADDLTKAVGTFRFELQARRPGEQIGTQVASWTIGVDSQKALRTYRDRLSRFFTFPLQLDQKPLPAGRYLLAVWLHLPDQRRLYDEYEFDYDGRGAPPYQLR